MREEVEIAEGTEEEGGVVGAAVGVFEVGAVVGVNVGLLVVGAVEGDAVGEEVVGAVVGEKEIIPCRNCCTLAKAKGAANRPIRWASVTSSTKWTPPSTRA